MPSFTFLTTVALALLSAAPSMGQTAPRGRPNHADLYGYPHARGDHSGTRAPVPPPGAPLTPGGYQDPRPANTGAECTANNQCSTNVRNARASCTTEGTCDYVCLGMTVRNEATGACEGMVQSDRCQYNRQCSTSVANASGICFSGRCSFACDNGFHADGQSCVADDTNCAGQTCVAPSGGYTVCENNQCVARCESQLGFRQYCNADNTVCQCINTTTDTNNCGVPGNVCPTSYNGKGRAYCAKGSCGLSCNRLTLVQPRDAPAYCS